MAKFLYQGFYTEQGLKGISKDGGTAPGSWCGVREYPHSDRD